LTVRKIKTVQFIDIFKKVGLMNQAPTEESLHKNKAPTEEESHQQKKNPYR
jgi:hypothetical protein